MLRSLIAILMSFVSGGFGLQGISTYYGGSTPTGTPLSACGNMSIASATYYLSQDVSSTGTCMSVTANGITLNLNGHTITYGTSSSSAIANGILGVDCGEPMWTTSGNMDTTNGHCATSAAFQNFKVFGGSITQGAGTLPQESSAIALDFWICATGGCGYGPWADRHRRHLHLERG